MASSDFSDPDQTQRIGDVRKAADRWLNRWPTVDQDKPKARAKDVKQTKPKGGK